MEKASFHHAFRVQYSGKVRQLITDCHIALPTAIRTTPDVQFHKFKTIWDTGATNSVITESVIRQLSLQPTGKVKTSGVHGEEVVSTYIVDIGLPNHVVIANVQVSEGKLIGGKVDVLIGMDIIQAGDFAICILLM